MLNAQDAEEAEIAEGPPGLYSHSPLHPPPQSLIFLPGTLVLRDFYSENATQIQSIGVGIGIEGDSDADPEA